MYEKFLPFDDDPDTLSDFLFSVEAIPIHKCRIKIIY